MKKQRPSTVFLVLSVLSVSSLLPSRADWVTVNPDGSVTRTTVTASSGPATNTPGYNHAPGQSVATPNQVRNRTPNQVRNNVSSYAYGVPSYPSTGYPTTGYYYPNLYPYYPPTTNYNQYYYYPPAPTYSGPIHPVPSYAVPPWITSVPLGNGYYPPAYPPYYGQPYPTCGVCYFSPCRCHGRGTSFSIGPGGVSITIKSGRQRSYTTNRR